MESNSSVVAYLFAVTFLIAFVVGLWQYFSVKRSKRQHENSADARVHGDTPGPVGGSGTARQQTRATDAATRH
jgi:hypothetical protein